MWSADPLLRVGGVLMLLGAALGGCTNFRPLYADPVALGIAAPDAGRALGLIAIVEIPERYGVELRNNLIFDLTGTGSEPANPEYRLEVTLSRNYANLAISAGTGLAAEGQVAMTARYRLVRLADSSVVTSSTLTSRVVFDRGVQRFANIRAERDADTRAAQELSQLIRNNLVLALSRPPA